MRIRKTVVSCVDAMIRIDKLILELKNELTEQEFKTVLKYIKECINEYLH